MKKERRKTDYAGSKYATQRKPLSPSARKDMKKYLKEGGREAMEAAQEKALKKRRKRRKNSA